MNVSDPSTTCISDVVNLSWHEVAMASHVGWMRHLSVLRHGRVGRNGFAGGGWTEHIEGACGELVVAKALGRYWNGSVDTWKADDVPGLQVRTRSQHDYELIVRDNDSDDEKFVLVTGRAPSFCVRGWMLGREAKRDEWRRSHGGHAAAFFVPHSALRAMSSLQMMQSP